jgi:general secretion pathway protein H
MVSWAAKAMMLKWALGSRPVQRMTPVRLRQRGFTLIELLMVVALIAIASGLATFALRSPAGTQLENEAARLVALLESARAQSRSTGIAVRWTTRPAEGQTAAAPSSQFRFIGLTPGNTLPQQWLNEGVSAEIGGAPALVLGPEPYIGAQRIVLSLEDQRLILRTDGLGPFEVSSADAEPAVTR